MRTTFSFTRVLAAAVTTTLLGGLLASSTAAQARLISTMPSPRGNVSQVVGVTKISVDYGRPGVKGRTVIGNPAIVAFDAAQPWRAGADENTVITFEHDVVIEGKPIPAGSYGVHMFPKSNGEWIVAFSSNTTAWGSYSYDAIEDVQRIETNAREGEFQEWLEYEFQDLQKNRADLVLRWETTEVAMAITVETDENVVAYLRDDYLRGHGFWMASQFAQAAAYCDKNDVNTEEAEGWAKKASNNTPTFANYFVQASLQDKLGKREEAMATRALAEPLASETQRNTIGYQLLQSGEVKKAISVFEANVKQFPMSWNAFDSLAEACAAAGDKERAIELYGKALEMVTDDTNKARIQGAISSLES